MSSPAASEQEGLLNRYAISDELGSGRFGRSVLATDTKTSNLCTLKYINAHLCDGTSAVLNSYLRIKHPNVLRHLAFVSNHRRSPTAVADSTVIVTEFAGFGSLKREIERRRQMFMESDSTKEVFGAAASETSSDGVLSSCGGSDIHVPSTSSESIITPFEDSSPGIYFSLLDIFQIVIQLLLAIRHLHKQKEVHRDITLQNIFIMEPDRVIKLGHCHAFDYEVMLGLQPPELIPILNTPVTSPRGARAATKTLKHWKEPCDIWAFGCALYEIVTLRPIRANWEHFLGFYLRQHCSEEWSLAFEKIITSCLQPNPAERVTISNLMSMREVLQGYNLLVSNRDLEGQGKLRHVLYYWEKSGSKKLQLKGLTPTAVYIPQPVLSLPSLKTSLSITQNSPHNSLSEEQILSPGRCQEKAQERATQERVAQEKSREKVGEEDEDSKGPKVNLISFGSLEGSSNAASRAGRGYKLPCLTNPSQLSSIGQIFQQPAEYRMLSRSTIRRSLSQEARDKFSKIDCRSVIQPRGLCQGFPSARSARGPKMEKSSADQHTRSTIASSAVRGSAAVKTSRTPKLVCAEPRVSRRTATMSRETTPPAPVRASLLPREQFTPTNKVKRVGSYYEVPIPREDRMGLWRDVQTRDREYNMIELAMKACQLSLEENLAYSSSQLKRSSCEDPMEFPENPKGDEGRIPGGNSGSRGRGGEGGGGCARVRGLSELSSGEKKRAARIGPSRSHLYQTTLTTSGPCSSPPPLSPPLIPGPTLGAPLSAISLDDPVDRIPLMVTEHKPTTRLPLPSTASCLFAGASPSDSRIVLNSPQTRPSELLRLATGGDVISNQSSGGLLSDFRRTTIGRSSVKYPGALLPTSHMKSAPWPSEATTADSLLKLGAGRYRSASHEHF